MKVGDLVKYLRDPTCIGVITEIGTNLYLVKWHYQEIEEWMPKLYADESVTQIPADDDEKIVLIVARDDYKNRAEQEAKLNLE